MIGRTLGNYRITEQIGIGGMATVYKAYDPGTDRYIALKVLPDYYSQDPRFRQRFEREAKAIAKLEHLHILPVHAYGEDGDTAYLVMRYMATGTLKERIQAGPISLTEASSLLKQVASALDYAHQHGVLHRDVKPSNVLLDADCNAYLTDFGIAKMVEGASELTGSGIIGTPQYMSPEQCQGRKDLTGATDVYSLGVMLYEMVTGRTPYQAETPLAIIHMQLTGAALPPPSSLRSDLPEEAEAALLKALAAEPGDRWQSCGEMADAFARAIAAAEMAIRPAAPSTDATKLPTPTQKIALEEDLGVTMPAAAKIEEDLGATMPAAAPVAVDVDTEAPVVTRPQAARRRLPPWAIGLAGLAVTGILLGAAWASGLFGGGREVIPCEDDHALCVGRVNKQPTVIFADEKLLVSGPTWSPDGKRIAFSGREPREEGNSIYAIDADGSGLTRLSNRCNDIDPAWSPDGKWIAFHSCGELVLMDIDGPRKINLQNQCALLPQWSPDSAWIVASVGLAGKCADQRPITREVRVISYDGKTVRVVATTTFRKTDADFSVAFSPDGKQVAYLDENGQAWLVMADGSGQPKPMDRFPFEWTGKIYPQWSK